MLLEWRMLDGRIALAALDPTGGPSSECGSSKDCSHQYERPAFATRQPKTWRMFRIGDRGRGALGRWPLTARLDVAGVLKATKGMHA